MNRIRSQEHARLFLGFDLAIALALPGNFSAICFDGFAMRIGSDAVDQRMLGSKYEIRGSVERVGRVVKTMMLRSSSASSPISPRTASVLIVAESGGAISKSISAPKLRPIQLRCISFSDSRPLQLIEIGQKTVGVRGDTEQSIAASGGVRREAADFAFAVDDFFVGQHRAQARTPVDGRFIGIGESFAGNDVALFIGSQFPPQAFDANLAADFSRPSATGLGTTELSGATTSCSPRSACSRCEIGIALRLIGSK